MFSTTANLTNSAQSSQTSLPLTDNTNNNSITMSSFDNSGSDPSSVQAPVTIFTTISPSKPTAKASPPIVINPVPDYEALKAAIILDNQAPYDDVEQTDENIILDMDGFMLDYIPPKQGFTENPTKTTFPVPRPYIGNFLRFVFRKYKRVSIWTAATKTWFDTCYEYAIRPNMPTGAAFHFVRTHPEGVPRSTIPLKPLRLIFGEHPEYTAANTTICDDNEWTFEDNRHNAEQVLSYFYDLLGHTPERRRYFASMDTALLHLIGRLKVRKPGNTGAVETIDKKSKAILSALLTFSEKEDGEVDEDDDGDLYA